MHFHSFDWRGMPFLCRMKTPHVTGLLFNASVMNNLDLPGRLFGSIVCLSIIEIQNLPRTQKTFLIYKRWWGCCLHWIPVGELEWISVQTGLCGSNLLIVHRAKFELEPAFVRCRDVHCYGNCSTFFVRVDDDAVGVETARFVGSREGVIRVTTQSTPPILLLPLMLRQGKKDTINEGAPSKSSICGI